MKGFTEALTSWDCSIVRVDYVFYNHHSKPESNFIGHLFVSLLNLSYARKINGVWKLLAVREAEALGCRGQDFGYFKHKPIRFLTSIGELGISKSTSL